MATARHDLRAFIDWGAELLHRPVDANGLPVQTDRELKSQVTYGNDKMGLPARECF